MPGGYTPPVRQRFEETSEALSHRFSLWSSNRTFALGMARIGCCFLHIMWRRPVNDVLLMSLMIQPIAGPCADIWNFLTASDRGS
jgi:hypothetical protein